MNRISASQLVMMITIFLYSETAAFLMAPISKTASYSAVISMCLGGACGFVIILFSASLARNNPGEYFAVFGREIVGKWVHIPVMLLLAAYLIHRAAMGLRNIEDFLMVNHLPTTPETVIAILLGLAVALTVRAGIEAVARISEVIFFVNLIIIVGLTPLLLGIELQLPMVHAFVTNFDIVRTAAGTYQATPWFGDAFVILFIYPHFKEHIKTGRMVFWGVCFALTLILSYLIPSLLAFGPELAGNMSYPVMEYVRTLRIADFIETLDPFLTILYIPAVIIKISVLLYAAVISLTRLFALHDHKPLSFAITAIAVGYSIHFADNVSELLYFMTVFWPTYALSMQLIPAVYWLIAKLRGKGKAFSKEKEPQSQIK
ncbi:endospore germination permease [Paenibacillus sp. MMS20-IR301]|uniref:GerAB/ArcD/ProY family transporter n=1 Tax=Paenibacillus sp. MMS20-IR301 TaxID=2895946 RepID=UPI0028E373D2|nr:endospore germination permease [Paenibacillus sp. MMS20-IR301]WNS43904.1 endospore germination permease [Paenibacillus sp. MMS20-IR301]